MAGRLQKQEVDAAGYLAPVVVDTLPSNAVRAGRLGAIDEAPHQLAVDGKDPQPRWLRLWDASWPDPTPFTHEATSPMALVCQNIDTKVEFGDFQRMLQQAVKPRNREQEG